MKYCPHHPDTPFSPGQVRCSVCGGDPVEGPEAPEVRFTGGLDGDRTVKHRVVLVTVLVFAALVTGVAVLRMGRTGKGAQKPPRNSAPTLCQGWYLPVVYSGPIAARESSGVVPQVAILKITHCTPERDGFRISYQLYVGGRFETGEDGHVDREQTLVEIGTRSFGVERSAGRVQLIGHGQMKGSLEEAE